MVEIGPNCTFKMVVFTDHKLEHQEILDIAHKGSRMAIGDDKTYMFHYTAYADKNNGYRRYHIGSMDVPAQPHTLLAIKLQGEWNPQLHNHIMNQLILAKYIDDTDRVSANAYVELNLLILTSQIDPPGFSIKLKPTFH